MIAIGILESNPVGGSTKTNQLSLTDSSRAKLTTLLTEIQYYRLDSLEHMKDSAPPSERLQRLRSISKALASFLGELDKLEEWTAAAHISQAINTLADRDRGAS
jgi:hypothetical protein